MAYTRPPAVAGSFYAGSREALRAQVRACFLHRLGPGAEPEVAASGPRRILGLVSPHAGFEFSGPPAAHGYAALAADGRPDVVVVISPQHDAFRRDNVTQVEGAWRTPLGDLPIDGETAERILQAVPLLEDNPHATDAEHSLEVQLPFLQYVFGSELPFVPIMLGEQTWENANELGAGLAEALADRDAVIIASTDLAHEPAAHLVEEKDARLLKPLASFDLEGYWQAAVQVRTTCGYGPVVAMLAAAQRLGANRVEVLAHSTSADVMPGAGRAVGYVSATVVRG